MLLTRLLQLVVVLSTCASCSAFSMPSAALALARGRVTTPHMAEQPGKVDAAVELQPRSGVGTPGTSEVIDVSVGMPAPASQDEGEGPLALFLNNWSTAVFLIFVGVNVWAVVDPSSPYNMNMAAGCYEATGC